MQPAGDGPQDVAGPVGKKVAGVAAADALAVGRVGDDPPRPAGSAPGSTSDDAAARRTSTSAATPARSAFSAVMATAPSSRSEATIGPGAASRPRARDSACTLAHVPGSNPGQSANPNGRPDPAGMPGPGGPPRWRWSPSRRRVDQRRGASPVRGEQRRRERGAQRRLHGGQSPRPAVQGLSGAVDANGAAVARHATRRAGPPRRPRRAAPPSRSTSTSVTTSASRSSMAPVWWSFDPFAVTRKRTGTPGGR